MSISYQLLTPIEYLKGVGPQRADLLKKELGIFTLKDLLQHYPFRYIDRTVVHKIRDIHPDMPAVQLLGRLTGLGIAGEKRGRRLVARFSDDTGTIDVVWFQSIRWLVKNLKEGRAYLLYGKPALFNNGISVTHPELELYEAAAKISGSMSLQPVYHSTEKLK